MSVDSPHGTRIAQWHWIEPVDMFSDDEPLHDRAQFFVDGAGNTTMSVRGHAFTWTPEVLEELRRILHDLSVRVDGIRNPRPSRGRQGEGNV